MFIHYCPQPSGSDVMFWSDNHKKAIAENDHYKFKDPNKRFILKIINVQESGAGYNTCLGRNSVGADSAYIYLNVTCKFYFLNNHSRHHFKAFVINVFNSSRILQASVRMYICMCAY